MFHVIANQIFTWTSIQSELIRMKCTTKKSKIINEMIKSLSLIYFCLCKIKILNSSSNKTTITNTEANVRILCKYS